MDDALKLCRHCSSQQTATTASRLLGLDTSSSATKSEAKPISLGKASARVSRLQQISTNGKRFKRRSGLGDGVKVILQVAI